MVCDVSRALKKCTGIVLVLVAACVLVIPAYADNGGDTASRGERIAHLNSVIDFYSSLVDGYQADLDEINQRLENALTQDADRNSAAWADAVAALRLWDGLNNLNMALGPMIKERDDLITQPFDEAIQQLGDQNAQLRNRMDTIAEMLAEAVENQSIELWEYDAGVNLLRFLNAQILINNAKVHRLTLAKERALEGGTGGSSDGGNDGGNDPCFVAGTLVLMADGSAKPIQDVLPGDEVMTYSMELDQAGPGVVAETRRGLEDHFYTLGGTLKTNDAHRFYVQGQGTTVAEDLASGDMLQGLNGPVELAGVEYTGLAVASADNAMPVLAVYNIMVEETHAYYVALGEAWVLVHDDCSCDFREQEEGAR
ncbi:MAG: hypothetical protein D6E12_06760 [Desulfovibrio sp.]|nr:MAG: hypothetical protein D6E12_06760 [Desulfovibrio sp.]